jgi:hypothetical protein
MNDGADFVRTAGEIEGERVLIECLSGCIKGKSWKEKVGRIEKCAGEENYRESLRERFLQWGSRKLWFGKRCSRAALIISSLRGCFGVCVCSCQMNEREKIAI